MGDDARSAAVRARAIPGALDIIGEVSDQPASRLTLANVNLMALRIASGIRMHRQAARNVARVLYGWESGAAKLRSELSTLPEPWHYTPDRPEEFSAYWSAVQAAADAVEKALSLIPTTARREWEPDNIDRNAPTPARLEGRAVAMCESLGLPVAGAPLLDVLEAAAGIRIAGQSREDRRRVASQKGYRRRKAAVVTPAKPAHRTRKAAGKR